MPLPHKALCALLVIKCPVLVERLDYNILYSFILYTLKKDLKIEALLYEGIKTSDEHSLALLNWAWPKSQL